MAWLVKRWKFWLIIWCRPLVDTFRMYLCADTDTFLQNVSVPIQIQHYKMYLCADTDTFPDTFWLIIDQNIVNFKFFVKYNGILSGLSIINIFLVKVTTFWLKNVGKIANFGSKGIVKSIGSLKCINTLIHF